MKHTLHSFVFTLALGLVYALPANSQLLSPELVLEKKLSQTNQFECRKVHTSPTAYSDRLQARVKIEPSSRQIDIFMQKNERYSYFVDGTYSFYYDSAFNQMTYSITTQATTPKVFKFTVKVKQNDRPLYELSLSGDRFNCWP